MFETAEHDRPVSYFYHHECGEAVVLVQRRGLGEYVVYHASSYEDIGGEEYIVWEKGAGPWPPMLYRLPDLLDAKRGEVVYVCEDEKDAENLATCGLLATTNFGGSGNWHDDDTATLAGRHVVILPDNDDAGRAHADQVVTALTGVAASVRVVQLPGLPEFGDVSDWLEAGADDLEAKGAASNRFDARIAELEELARLAPETLPPSTGPVAVVTSLADVVTRPVEWLWEDWLPRGKLSLIGGHPVDGKSTLTAALASTLSVGGLWPDGTPAPRGATIFLLAEDALDDTLRPRLEQHGADLTMTESLDAVRHNDGRERSFSLGEHLDALERRIVATRAALVVVDPLSAFLSSRNRNDDGEIRDLLTPLGKLAERRNVAILGVMHVGKPGAVRRTLLQSLMGSTAFGAVARLALMVHPLPDDERRLLAVIKSNLARKPKPLEWSRPDDSAIVWHGESEYDLEAVAQTGGETRSPRDNAEAFLTGALAGGPRLSREVFEEAEQLGISKRTLQRVIARVGVESRRIGPGRDAPWHIGSPGVEWAAHAATVAGVEQARDE